MGGRITCPLRPARGLTVRHITRTTPPPASLSETDTNSAGARELLRARGRFAPAQGGQVEGTFNFVAYKGADVREALRADFHRKCAYCESFYAATMPDDVEHYRPKAAFVENGQTVKPGYWWLAMKWSNLLPSCADCNRGRKLQVAGETGRKTLGKANQFPLAAGTARARAEGAETTERPMLLDPTVDDPAEHLEFLPDGNIRPAQINGKDSERGAATIDVVALRRIDLVHARKMAATTTATAIENVRHTQEEIAFLLQQNGIDPDQRQQRLTRLRLRLREQVHDMELKAAPETPYSAVADALVRAFKAELNL